MEELSLKVEHVSKEYRLGTIGGGTLKAELQDRFAKLRHKESPNLMIGQKEYDKNERFLALDDVSLKIKKGERIGIIGHNGAGKSTLLKLICRVTAPTSGNIYINGRITSMLEVGTGFHGELTGKENIYLNGAILGMTKEEVAEKYDQIVEFSEINQFIDTPIKRYSSGMKVKLGFAVASHLNSEIMIMDEVLAVGDMAFQNKCLEQMRKVAEEEGRTILYVSHNMSTIRNLCERCIVLEHGKIVFDGDVEKAIAIYLNSEYNDVTRLNYESIPRLNWLKDTKIKTLSAEYIDKSDIIFKTNDKMVISLSWLNEKRVDDICLRIEILDRTRSPIGTAYFKSFYSGKENDIGSAVIQIDVSHLITGSYTMNFVFFEINPTGANITLDCVHGLFFEIRGDEDIIWNKNTLGIIKFDDSKLLEVD